MAATAERIIVVTGATGLQGREVAQQLHGEGWRVRALTRKPGSKKAQALAARGIALVQGDMMDPASLAPVFQGAYGVFNVQSPYLSSIASEYGSAGVKPEPTGVPSWDSKLVVEAHMQALGLPVTVLRPMAFMELMTDPKFFPAVSIGHLMPLLVGGAQPIGWLSVRDLGVIVAKVFAEPERYLGQNLQLLSDVKSLDECHRIYAEVLGRKPPRFPMPARIFARFGLSGQDLDAMWRWLRTGELVLDPQPTLAIHPQALTVRTWMKKQSRR
jgi:uncharacterized protein YbjT (DUF2867 family)